MPLDDFALDLAVKGILTGGLTQLRIHSDDPGAAVDGNEHAILYNGLNGGPNVANNQWRFFGDGRARPLASIDWPIPPDGFATVAATWITAWRGDNRMGRFRVQARNPAQPDETAADAYIDGSVDIQAQRIPRLLPENFVWRVPGP